jgi:hypothetical protein
MWISGVGAQISDPSSCLSYGASSRAPTTGIPLTAVKACTGQKSSCTVTYVVKYIPHNCMIPTSSYKSSAHTVRNVMLHHFASS